MPQLPQAFRRPCLGPGVEHGHQLQTVHGLSFCTVCGLWTSGDRMADVKLGKPCVRTATKHRRQLLRRLGRSPPLPPYHLTAWPDGTAIAVRHSKRKCRQGSLQAVALPVASQPKTVLLKSTALESVRARVFERIRAAAGQAAASPPAG